MSRAAFQRLLFATGVAVALMGVFFATQTSHEFRWNSIVAIAIITVGMYMAIVGLLLLLNAPTEPEAQDRMVLPEVSIPLLYGGFIGVVSLVSGLVAGYYLGRNEGFITFIFAFIVANLLFGIPLVLARAGASR